MNRNCHQKWSFPELTTPFCPVPPPEKWEPWALGHVRGVSQRGRSCNVLVSLEASFPPKNMGKIHYPEPLWRVCKTNIQERNILLRGHPTKPSISHIPGLEAHEQYWSSQPELRDQCRGSAVSWALQIPQSCLCMMNLQRQHGNNGEITQMIRRPSK